MPICDIETARRHVFSIASLEERPALIHPYRLIFCPVRFVYFADRLETFLGDLQNFVDNGLRHGESRLFALFACRAVDSICFRLFLR